MKQEDKDLLLKDLCARLPYGIKCRYQHIQYIENGKIIDINMFGRVNVDGHVKDICDVKPYLFPLSSMTEEQCKELRNLIYEHFTLDDDFNEGILFKTYGDILVWLDEKPINECYFIFDWFHKNHFDYRNLINKNIAIDCTNLNIY